MSHCHLSLRERLAIEQMLLFGLSRREISRRLGRHHSTIGREILRNQAKHAGSTYIGERGERLAKERRQRRRHQRRRSFAPLWTYVRRRLRAGWSPEQISGRLWHDHPGSRQMRVAHETIYQWIFQDARRGGRLFEHLRRRHKKRRRPTKIAEDKAVMAMDAALFQGA